MTSFVASTVCNRPRRRSTVFIESALNRRFLVYALSITLLIARPGALTAAPCSTPAYDQELGIRHVIDGDTLVVNDGRKLRLIGIDTPELGRDRRPHEKGALEARDFLRALLSQSGAYPVVFGSETHDHHGRLLAHLFLGNGDNVQALLLLEGYATTLNIPPNISFSDCYDQQQAIARNSSRGLWALAQYQPLAAQHLGPDSSGFRIVFGELSRLGESRTAIWLNFGKHLGIRIQRKDLPYFPELQLKAVPGTRLEARGRLYRRKGQLRMTLRHGNDLKILTEDKN